MAMPAILRSMFERDSNPNSTPGAAPSSGGTLVCPDGRALPLRQTALRARAKGGVAIEAFPRRVEAEVADEELWRGPEGALTACGFTVSAGDPAYPVMCLRL